MLNAFNSKNRESENTLNASVVERFSKLKLSVLFLPTLLLVSIVLFLYSRDSLSASGYVQIQKGWFYVINSKLSMFPGIVYNLTQFGDALIFLSLLTVFIIYSPKIWEALISASLVSAVLSRGLKTFFSIPRPAQILDETSFVIIGKKLVGYSSLPSGHSITIFTILTVLMIAFMPKKWAVKIPWLFLVIITGLLLSSTRVGVGAHHTLDVLVGCLVGSISGLIGVFISRKYTIWAWINHKKYYPIFMVLFLVCSVVLIFKIREENLIIYYFSFASLLFSLYKITHVYLKK